MRNKRGIVTLSPITVLSVILIFIGIILIYDEIWLIIPGSNIGHILPDLSWVDGGNPYIHHWMFGVVLLFVGAFLLFFGGINRRKRRW